MDRDRNPDRMHLIGGLRPGDCYFSRSIRLDEVNPFPAPAMPDDGITVSLPK